MTVRLIAVRHGPTRWNRDGLMQGRADIPLDGPGRCEVARWRLPKWSRVATWRSSPLLRATETARILGLEHVVVDERLVEMDWGRWEGCSLAGLRARHRGEMRANEARGLEFRPPGGETPREVQARLRPLLRELAGSGTGAVGMVTHKGVIRALLALATGWDMLSGPGYRVPEGSAQVFRLEDRDRLSLDCPALALVPERCG